MTTKRAIAFVAYGSKDVAVAQTVADAVHRANALSLPIRYEPWTFNDVPGVSLVSPILSGIDDSVLIVADISDLNLNVIFEIGYAIGKGKRAFLIRHKDAGDKSIAREAGIFDTLGYFEYSSVLDLRDRLSSHIETTPIAFNSSLNSKAPIYIIEPPVRSDANVLLTSRVKKAGYRYRSFNPSEDVRLSANDAIRQVAASAGVVMLLQREDYAGAREHNIRALFVAGLATGMDKPLLVLSPIDSDPPLDVRDLAKSFRHPNDIIEQVTEFCPQVNRYAQEVEPPPIEVGGLLESLVLGDPTAENEMTTLGEYYLRTDQYQRAVRGEVNLVVGRKGSGKTALFIQVRDKIRSDKRNIVVDLKPEGYQLIKLKEDILQFLAEGARQHLVTAFWEYLILLEVAYKILEKDKNTYKFNHEIHDLYLELDRNYRTDRFSVEGDFSERLSALSRRLSDEYRSRHPEGASESITSQEVSQVLYAHNIRDGRLKLHVQHLARSDIGCCDESI